MWCVIRSALHAASRRRSRLYRRRLCGLVVLLGALLAPLSLPAQDTPSGRLTVTVTDTLGRGLADAAVRVSGLSRPIHTDADGTVQLEAVTAGSVLLRVELPGYEEQTAVVELAAGEHRHLAVVLAPPVVPLDTLRVTGRARDRALDAVGFYDRLRQGQGRFITPEQIERLAPRLPDTFSFFRQVPGFRLVPGPRGFGWRLVSTRGAVSLGSSGCEPAVFLDGRRSDMGELSSLSPLHVRAIEVYRGSATVPVEYTNSSGSCGAVLVWLKR